MIFLYSALDKIKGKVICNFSSANDGLAIREQGLPLSKFIPLGDVELLCIGEINDDTGLPIRMYDGHEIRIVDWNSYKIPESPIIPKVSKPQIEINKN